MKTRFRYVTIGYFALAVVYLFCLLFAPIGVQFLLKCAFMPILLAGLVSVEEKQSSLLRISLLMAWVGDIVISYADLSEMYFLGGLVAFLLAHLAYIKLFKDSIRTHPQNRGYHTWALSILAIVLILLLILLLPKAGKMAIPIVFYAITITAMMVFAIKGWAHWPTQAADWLVAGAASFVVSDGILALNKFYHPIPFAAIGIMATYLFAQWAIVRGMLEINADVDANASY
jgi:uncharacterized membrane protein YhhN